jgi:hypothetical protein
VSHQHLAEEGKVSGDVGKEESFAVVVVWENCVTEEEKPPSGG